MDSQLQAECHRYTITFLESSCTPSPLDLNETNDLVGRWYCPGGNDRAFVSWNAGPVILLNIPNQEESRAYGINSNAEIVGWAALADVGSTRGFLWFSGQVTNLGILGGNWAEAFAINDKSIVVGFSDVDGSANHAFRWQNMKMYDLGLPIGPNNEARDINQEGQIVGWMGTFPDGTFYSEGFVWDDGLVTALGIPLGATNSTANAINNNGLICGTYAYPNPNPNWPYPIRRALVWSDGKMMDLGMVANFQRAYGEDVNDHGYVVGRLDNPPPINTLGAFVWHSGTMKSLTELLGPNPLNYRVVNAYGINNQGNIAGQVSVPGVGPRGALLRLMPPRTGDTNCDWSVNVDDLLAVINAWGPFPNKTGPFSGSPDLDANGVVNVDDLLIVIGNWG